MDTTAKILLKASAMAAALAMALSAAASAIPDGNAASQHAVAAAHDAGAEHDAGLPHRARRLSPDVKPTLDRSGRKRVGKASFYAKMFAGRKMADGTRMEPTANNAASLTLPLGTTARVTNLETGKTALVTIRDRGPYVSGRIVDLSPATAHEIGLDRRTGVTRVEVAPIAVPMPDGQLKLGDGMLQANNNSNTDTNGADIRSP